MQIIILPIRAVREAILTSLILSSWFILIGKLYNKRDVYFYIAEFIFTVKYENI
ncbi:hypothetical protein TPE_0015 [Treponema pedis str. T A4]|uniref:Uncharacterized protein n=1 Tax=Treponema pedis str. T A4 TaxID=1291379 RepID=S5ZWV0_9SPIR|nr:hypothetical protein TPE_0015 [Treponema pedis str. T A4]